MKSKLLSVCAAALMSLAADCGHFSGARSTKMVAEFKGRSDYSVVLIPNIHNSFECQANSYLLLESLRDDTFFVAQEGFEGWSTYFNYKGPYFPKGKGGEEGKQKGMIEDFIGMPLEERIAAMHNWIRDNDLPEGTSMMPLRPDYMFEAVYQDEVRTFGVDSLNESLEADAVNEEFKRGRISKEKFIEVMLKKREGIFVENILSIADKLERNGNHLIPFSVGAYHLPGLRRLLEQKEVSYKAFELEGCDPLMPIDDVK